MFYKKLNNIYLNIDRYSRGKIIDEIMIIYNSLHLDKNYIFHNFMFDIYSCRDNYTKEKIISLSKSKYESIHKNN